MATHMMAARVDAYGPPDAITISPTPIPEPGRGEVLVRIEAAAVTSGDARLRSGRFPTGFGLPARLAFGIRGPRAKVPGMSFSGRVERLGAEVTRFAPGDEVAGMTGSRLGAHAEYVAVPATALTLKPAAVTHPDAAGVLFGGTTALYFLRDRARLRAGQTVLVNGASGSVGSSAVQLAAHDGAIVTAVSSARSHVLLRQLGASHVIDYRATPVTSMDERFDVVIDTVGNLNRASGRRLLTPTGALILVAADLLETITARGRIMAGSAPERVTDFAFLLGLVAAGTLDPLVEIIGGLGSLPDAHRRVDSHRKVGNIVILPHADRLTGDEPA